MPALPSTKTRFQARPAAHAPRVFAWGLSVHSGAQGRRRAEVANRIADVLLNIDNPDIANRVRKALGWCTAHQFTGTNELSVLPHSINRVLDSRDAGIHRRRRCAMRVENALPPTSASSFECLRSLRKTANGHLFLEKRFSVDWNWPVESDL